MRFIAGVLALVPWAACPALTGPQAAAQAPSQSNPSGSQAGTPPTPKAPQNPSPAPSPAQPPPQAQPSPSGAQGGVQPSASGPQTVSGPQAASQKESPGTAAGSQAPLPASPGPLPPAPGLPGQATPHEAEPLPREDGRLYSMTIKNKEADDVLLTLAQKSGVHVAFLSPSVEMLTLSFERLSLHRAMDLITEAAGLEYRYKNGTYLFGLPMDIQLRFPPPSERALDATYHCRHLDASTLSSVLANMFPGTELRVSPGPRFLSPSLENADPSGITGETGVRTLGSTNLEFKVHDIILSGPAELVRRAIMFARKFDRPRKQVRINIRIVEVQENSDRNLGLFWNTSLPLGASEQSGSQGATTVEGIRLGKFSHAPLVVNTTLNALEHEGKARTLSNPSLLLMDGERSFILSGQKLLYPKNTGKDLSGLPVYDVAEVKVGIYLQVAVHLGLNNDVLMSVVPQVTSALDFKTYSAGTSYPVINTREAQTTVHAYNGEMVVLGGLRQDSQTDANDGLPFLRRIPILGGLFSNTSRNRKKGELMIFLTPEIIDDLDHIENVDIQATDAPAA